MELRLDPRPYDQTNRTGARLVQPSRQSKTDSRARISLGHEESEDDRAFSILGRLVHPDDRALDLAYVFDPFMNFDHQNFSKARILHLSDDLAHVWTRPVREENPAVPTDRPACVLLLTAMYTSGYIEPGQE
ncbi:hypothetical protein F2Q69_00013943 [Brassica cretica]|uniref:Uncharacterized protein n=1 Tax=Brassica cretica TaxID=69181 RepID=A0A8S9R788_BRACR|nr:hypothetical protein F2Q69_00013943 [Brassica cretica]